MPLIIGAGNGGATAGMGLRFILCWLVDLDRDSSAMEVELTWRVSVGLILADLGTVRPVATIAFEAWLADVPELLGALPTPRVGCSWRWLPVFQARAAAVFATSPFPLPFVLPFAGLLACMNCSRVAFDILLFSRRISGRPSGRRAGLSVAWWWKVGGGATGPGGVCCRMFWCTSSA